MQKCIMAQGDLTQSQKDNFFRIILTARNRPELLERVLRVIRYRGFRVQRLESAMTEIGTVSLSILLSASGREASFLLPQLQRLPDIQTVTID